MKVLLSAIACHPERGSEGAVGWNAVCALSDKHELHVLTSASQRAAIARAVEKGRCQNVSFYFFGSSATYHENRLIARLQSWVRYLSWMKESEQVASHLHANHCFDLIHHVTYSSWRVPSRLWQLQAPFVWGPIGGVAEYPMRLLSKLSVSSAGFEIFRHVMNLYSLRSKQLSDCVRKATAVVCSNRETIDALQKIRGSATGMYMLSPTFFTNDQMALFRLDAAAKDPTMPLRCFAGGNIIGSKGLIFALEALQAASQKSIQWQLVVGGYGPEIPFLKKKAQALGIADQIDFHVGFKGDAYRQKLKDAHVFILPSFRENAPGTILEAMLAGCVPVVVDASAQGDIVASEFGFKVPVKSAGQITEDIADSLVELARNPAQRVSMGQRASEYVARNYSEDSYISGIEAIYKDVLRTK